MKRFFLTALAAIALCGCASDHAYLQAQAEAITAQANARVAEAQAITAIAAKLDAGGASAYAVMVAAKGATQQPQQVFRPRDWVDYVQAFTGLVGAAGNIAVPIVGALEAGKTNRALYASQVQMEGARQTGETGRFTSLADVMRDVATAPRPPTSTSTTTINAGGDVVNGGGTIDRRNCPTTGGNGAPSGQGPTSGPGGTSGSASGGC